MDRDLRIVPSGSFAAAGAEVLAGAIREALTARGRCELALAGGSTPRPVYRRLAAVHDLEWTGVHVFFGDERAVPPDDPESNYRMARRSLLDRVPIPGSRRHRIEGEREDLDGVAAEYGRHLPDRLDVLVLGVGEDGHTASLFPGSEALEETGRRATVVEGPRPPVRRVTVTPPVVRSARTIVVLAAGRHKANAVLRAVEGDVDPRECPARLARDGIWVLDRAAASRLSPESVRDRPPSPPRGGTG